MEHFRLAELCVTLLRAVRDPVVISRGGAAAAQPSGGRKSRRRHPERRPVHMCQAPSPVVPSATCSGARGVPDCFAGYVSDHDCLCKAARRDSPASSGSVYWPSATSSGPLEGGLVRRVPSNFPGVTQSRSAAHWTGADQRAPDHYGEADPFGSPDAWPRSRGSRFRLVDTTLH